MLQELYAKAKKIIKKGACMKFYDASNSLYLETDASHVSLGTRLLHRKVVMNCGYNGVPDNATLCAISFASKSLLRAEWCYSNIE